MKSLRISLGLGFMISTFGVLAEAILRLAYSHNAISGTEDTIIYFLIWIQWPGLLLESKLHILPLGTTDFGNSHSLAEGFWEALLSYWVVNGIGWGLAILLIVFLAERVYKKVVLLRQGAVEE